MQRKQETKIVVEIITDKLNSYFKRIQLIFNASNRSQLR